MNDDIVRRGYLHHQVSITSCFRIKKSWQRVFVLLKDGCLFLFDSPRDLQPLHTLPLYASCCIFPQFPKVARSNCLQLETPTASVFLCADSPADIKEWAIRIQKAAIVASGGSIGKLHATTANAGGVMTPNNKPRHLVDGLSSIEFPQDSQPVDSMPHHSPEAAALVADALEQARYERVLQRFRSSQSITAFTSNLLPCLTVGGPYAKMRAQAKRRIASEWLHEARAHTKENHRRGSLPHEVHPLTYDVEPLGTLSLASQSVTLFAGQGSLTVTNTADYPIALRVGDRSTIAWLRTNTPMWLKPAATTTITLTTADAPPTPALTPTPAPPTQANGKSLPTTATTSKPSPSPPPSKLLDPPAMLPCLIPISLKPCDASDFDSIMPRQMFDDEDGQPTHRIGEKYLVEVKNV